ncbi:MAG: hypothetical protein NVS4B2_23360 [Chloroflexota bacterium]
MLGAVLLIGLAPRLDTDLWWHLKEGGYIWNHRTIPAADFYSFTFSGRSWTDHEWLTELVLYGLYSLAGLWGTIVAFAIIICATYGLVYLRMAGLGVNRFLALFVMIFAIVAASSTWGARPQMISMLFLAAYALVVDRFVRTRDRRILLVLPVLMLPWTNMHGGWILGLALLIIALVGESLNHRRDRENALSSADLKVFAGAIVVTFIVTFVNPYGLQQVLYPLVWIFPSAYSNVLNEWVSSDFHQPVVMVFEVMLLLLIVTMYVGRARFNWTHMLMILAFTHLALSQSRNVAVWSVVISPLLAFYIDNAILANKRSPHVQKRSGLLSRRTERIVNVTLLAFVTLLFPLEAFHFVTPGALTSSETSTFPAGAMTYMDHHALPPRTYASYAWGGYVIWRGWPHYQDFIDGRANTLFDARILDDYMNAFGAAPSWSSILDRHGVQNVLVNPQAPLAQVVAMSHRWRLVYKDQVSVLYTRR